jgi:hypothetical protein
MLSSELPYCLHFVVMTFPMLIEFHCVHFLLTVGFHIRMIRSPVRRRAAGVGVPDRRDTVEPRLQSIPAECYLLVRRRLGAP